MKTLAPLERMAEGDPREQVQIPMTRGALRVLLDSYYAQGAAVGRAAAALQRTAGTAA